MSSDRQPSLLTQRKFLPYFVTQFFGAFNDNIFKNVLLLFVAFAGSSALPISSNLFINLAAGLFILPFFLFSASAGVLADKYEKSWFIRKVKLFEIAIMLLGAVGFITESYGVLLLLLFLMGTQSAFFGPVKYALLPQELNAKELVPGNAWLKPGHLSPFLSARSVQALLLLLTTRNIWPLSAWFYLPCSVTYPVARFHLLRQVPLNLNSVGDLISKLSIRWRSRNPIASYFNA